MGQLVIDDRRDPLAGGLRGVHRVNQQRGLAIGHQTPVFHCPGGKIRQRHHVEFGKGIGNAEPAGKIRQRVAALLQGKSPLFLDTGTRPDAHRNAVGVVGLQAIQLRHHKRQQIGGHARGFLKTHSLPVRSGLTPLLRRHIGENRHAFGHGERRLEGGFAGRLIPAGEAPPGVGGLELRGRSPAFLPVDGICGAVKPMHFVVQLTREDEVEFRRAFLQLLAELQRNGFFFFVPPDTFRRQRCAFERRAQIRLGDLQIQGVQHHPSGWFVHKQRNGFRASEGELFQVGC